MKTRFQIIYLLIIVLSYTIVSCSNKDHAGFCITEGETIEYYFNSDESVILATFDMLSEDMEKVLDAKSVKTTCADSAKILVLVGTDKSVADKSQAYRIDISASGQFVINGSDAHGAAYGMIELSRLLGVSPWVWWANSDPQKLARFCLPASFSKVEYPDVEYRGIFINDEDWGLNPWSYKTNDPSEKGTVGAKTTERIFQLLIRLKANAYWPPMHECSKPFFFVEGNREMAEKYGIYIGSSHCEPMVCNVANEWGLRGEGEYDYLHNSRKVYEFFEDRVKEVADQEIIYTIGMRGIHDGAMNGVETIDEQRNVLAKVIDDQRTLLTKYVCHDVTKVPQVFIPYKEVLDVYNSGLEVPDEVTLMWCDDNYGYIRHFPTDEEKARKGGNGIYYHVSYWGRPHDYLWLGTMNPYLIFHQMSKAFDKGIQKMWILNVGDIKPSEYLIELFLDMAWDIDAVRNKGVTNHLSDFLSREFGRKNAANLTKIMKEHYRLAYIRKPEFLGNTRCEESDPDYNVVKDLPWSENYINTRIEQYKSLGEQVKSVAENIDEISKYAFYHLVEYPVLAAGQMNVKMLGAQLARHGKAEFSMASNAFDSIASMTNRYNQGRWKNFMDFQPRKLPVFDPVKIESASYDMVDDISPVYSYDGEDIKGQIIPQEGIGYNARSVELIKNEIATLDLGDIESDSITMEMHFVPTHPIDGDLRFSIWVDGMDPVETSYATVGRSEEWKQNILRNQAIKSFRIKTSDKIYIKALNEGEILDQVLIY